MTDTRWVQVPADWLHTRGPYTFLTDSPRRPVIGPVLAVREEPPAPAAAEPEQGDAGEQQSFPIGDILSLTTGQLVSYRGITAIYALLGWLEGRPVFTHELPRMSERYVPLLLAQHPFLIDVSAPLLDSKAEIVAWVSKQAARYGETLTVTLPPREVGR